MTQFEAETTFALGNPLAEAATIDLRVRPLDLPAGWMVDVWPSSVLLAPGEQITATAYAIPPSTAVQGTVVRFAVEGYAGAQLIGGIVMDVPVPEYREFGASRILLPLVWKSEQ